MPYISQDRRDAIRNGEPPANVGELNFLLTTIVDEYVTLRGLSYAVLNDVDGVLGLAQHEFRRRVVAPYEDRKQALQGDVYRCVDGLV